jgi:hypothetical protein
MQEVFVSHHGSYKIWGYKFICISYVVVFWCSYNWRVRFFYGLNGNYWILIEIFVNFCSLC